MHVIGYERQGDRNRMQRDGGHHSNFYECRRSFTSTIMASREMDDVTLIEMRETTLSEQARS